MLKKEHIFWKIYIVCITLLCVFLVVFLIVRYTKKDIEMPQYEVKFIPVLIDVTPKKDKNSFIDDNPDKKVFYDLLATELMKQAGLVVAGWGSQNIETGGYVICPTSNLFYPPDIECSYYKYFVGFYTDISCSERFDFAVKIERDTVIFARFEFDILSP